MKRTVMSLGLLAMLAGAASTQQQEPRKPEKKLVFNFREAQVDFVLQYVCRELGWTLVYSMDPDKRPRTPVTVWNDKEVPEAEVIEFLNTALKPAKVAVFQFMTVLKVVTEDEAKRGTYNIYYGCEPDKIPPSDTIRTQIIPLKNINVVDVTKELKAILDDAASGKWAINTYANAVVVTQRSSEIYRLVRIFNILDIRAADQLLIKPYPMKHADAAETAKLLNELFRREQRGPQQGQGGFGQMLREMWGGRGGGGEQGPQARTMASETLRITHDTRINAVIAMATKENHELIEKTIVDLDKETAEAIRLKHYPLRYADATATAQIITQVFADEHKQAQQAQQRGRNPFMPFQFGGQQPTEQTGASREVRAIADTRTNAIIVAANEVNMRICDQLVERLDQQINDMVTVKIFRLKNADPTTMATILTAMFRPQVNATQQAGRTTGGGQQGGGGFFGQVFGNQGGRAGGQTQGLPPAQEVEITSDTRTRSVIMKASEQYLAIAEAIIKDLDEDPTEQYKTYVLPLSNANASEVAQILQNLMRGSGAQGQGQRQGQNQGFGQLPGFGNQQNTQNRNQQGGTRGNTGGANRGGTTGGARRNLGPLPGQDPQDPGQDPGLAPQEEEQRRGLEGAVDVQPDPATNSLVIRTSPKNFDAIQNIVRDLDRMRPQVLIKVLIAEVTLDHSLNFGVEGFWENKFRVNGDAITQRYSSDFNLPAQGGAALFTGDELQANLKLLAEDGKLKVLATPRILVLDNQTANINVGKQVPRVTNSTINQQGNTVNTVTYEDLGILLEVQPHINFDGLVTMLVRPEISDIAPASEAVQITEGVTSPTFFVNSAETTVAARSGQTIAIGGLIRESEEDSVQKIPLLGDIPLLGALFSSTTKAKVKRELMIFLTPYVAFNSAQLEEITQLEKSKLKLLDPRDIDSESDRWLDLMKLKKE